MDMASEKVPRTWLNRLRQMVLCDTWKGFVIAVGTLSLPGNLLG